MGDLPYKLILVGIFKNESHILDEWITHYLNMGVDKVFLIDNGSTDDYQDIISKYINDGKLELKIDNQLYAQTDLYNKHFLHYCKHTEWVLIADLDEFVYAKNGFKKITEYLDTIRNKNIGSIKIPWKQFGSNGYIDQPHSVINAFTKRQNVPVEHLRNCKSITRGNYITQMHTHDSDIDNNYEKIMANNKIDDKIKSFTKLSESIIENSYLNLNHYPIQSLNWFQKVKMTRGDASSASVVRDLQYFRDYDWNEIEDKELSNMCIKN